MSRYPDSKGNKDVGKISSEKGIVVEIVSFVYLVFVFRQSCCVVKISLEPSM